MSLQTKEDKTFITCDIFLCVGNITLELNNFRKSYLKSEWSAITVNSFTEQNQIYHLCPSHSIEHKNFLTKDL